MLTWYQRQYAAEGVCCLPVVFSPQCGRQSLGQGSRARCPLAPRSAPQRCRLHRIDFVDVCGSGRQERDEVVSDDVNIWTWWVLRVLNRHSAPSGMVVAFFDRSLHLAREKREQPVTQTWMRTASRQFLPKERGPTDRHASRSRRSYSEREGPPPSHARTSSREELFGILPLLCRIPFQRGTLAATPRDWASVDRDWKEDECRRTKDFFFFFIFVKHIHTYMDINRQFVLQQVARPLLHGGRLCVSYQAVDNGQSTT